MKMPCIAFVGDLSDGYTPYGPYPDFNAAARSHPGDDVWIMALRPPPRPRERMPRYMAIVLEGGLVQSVISDNSRALNDLLDGIYVIDHDVDGVDPDALTCIKPLDTTDKPCNSFVHSFEVEPTKVDLEKLHQEMSR